MIQQSWMFTIIFVDCPQISIEEVARSDDVMSEVDLMQQISHSNIVRFYGATRERYHLNIFMEWMDGKRCGNLC